MSSTTASTEPARRVWIVSAWWDLIYLVITPVIIVPAALLAVRQWLTPEQVYLAAISFASLGHHLPGFMRAYGDRELFERFRTRFLLAPPLVLAVALLFTPPSWLAEALHLPWRHLHGLELILFVWGTWHGLMQTYGFMRIYDIRRGENIRSTARLDHAVCLSIFIAGVAFSDGRMHEIAGIAMQSGLPTLDRQGLIALRWIVGAASAAVALLYVVHLWRRRRTGLPINGIKLLLAAVTGWFYWYCGRIPNLLVGVAMFEIFHAVQYNAIVWIYNRRLLDRAGERFGPLGFLFRDRLMMLCFYLAAIGAYSSIRYFTADANDRMFSGSYDAHQWLIALFVTSSALHFYYDGFIWKVSDRRTQDNLVDEPTAGLSFERLVPALVHAGRWAMLAAVVVALLLAERAATSGDRRMSEADRLRKLSTLTPELPEAMAWRVIDALEEADYSTAIAIAKRAADMRPRSHQDQARLADALMAADRYKDAVAVWRRTLALHPTHWQYRAALAESLDQAGSAAEAEVEFNNAVDLGRGAVQPYQHLAEFYRRHNRPVEAIPPLRAAVQRLPDDARMRVALGGALAGAGQFEHAVAELTAALRLDPDSAEGHYRLGAALLQSGDPGAAVAPLQRAIALEPEHPQARLQLGDAFYALQKWRPALQAYQRAVEMHPGLADAWVNLASVQLNVGDVLTAEATLRKGLERIPDSATLQFTLGYLLRETGREQQGTELLREAEAAGLKASPRGK